MGNGVFTFAVVASIVLCAGFVVASAIMRAAWAQREREALTSNDLRALEESAVILIERLKSEADAAITEIDKRRKSLSKLIKDADEKLRELAAAESRTVSPVSHQAASGPSTDPQSADVLHVLELSETGMEPAEIAKATGIDCAEVGLILSLSRKVAA